MDVVISRARESLPLHDDIRWTCPVDSHRECTIRAFQEDDKTYVNIFENDIDGLYDLNVRNNVYTYAIATISDATLI